MYLCLPPSTTSTPTPVMDSTTAYSLDYSTMYPSLKTAPLHRIRSPGPPLSDFQLQTARLLCRRNDQPTAWSNINNVSVLDDRPPSSDPVAGASALGYSLPQTDRSLSRRSSLDHFDNVSVLDNRSLHRISRLPGPPLSDDQPWTTQSIH